MTKLTKNMSVLALCFLLIAGIAHAGSYRYSDQAKRLKAGVLLPVPPLASGAIASASYLSAFYTFYVMNTRLDVKPAGWDFYNPAAPSHITPAIAQTWGSTIYTEGATVTKDMACYWAVNLDEISSYDLAQYDVLLLPVGGTIGYTAENREKLRKFVDNGGVLWIDNYGGTFDNSKTSSFFIPDLGFSTSGNPSTPFVVPDTSKFHSLVNRPFMLSFKDINALVNAQSVTGQSAGTFPSLGNKNYFTSIITDSGGETPVVSTAQYGSGSIVASGAPISQGIAGPVGMSGGTCGTAFMNASTELIKLGCNIVSLGTVHSTFQKSPRHAGYSFGQIGAPLAVKWTFPCTGTANVFASPAVLDDLVYYVGNDYNLYALELSPKRDRDGDGNPDDGMADPPGVPYDVIWKADLGGAASSPTVAYMPVPSSGATPKGASVPIVFITLASSEMKAFDGRTGDPVSLGITHGPQGGVPFDDSVQIPSPTYVDGSVYWSDGAGCVHGYNLLSAGLGNTDWINPDAAQPGMDPFPKMGQPFSPTVGYYYNSASGATEQVLYLARMGMPLGVLAYYGTIDSYPTRVYNETLSPDGQTPALYNTRAWQKRIPIVNGTYTVYKVPAPPGAIEDITSHATLVPGQEGKIQIEQTWASTNLVGCSVIANYELDYTKTDHRYGPRQAISITHEKNPSTGEDLPIPSGMVGSPAAGRNDVLYFGTDNGSLYAVRDRVRGINDQMTVLWRWFAGKDAKPFGTPAVAGDMVYFAVNVGTSGRIYALKANPVFTVDVGEPIQQGTGVQITQWDALTMGRQVIISSSTSKESTVPMNNINFVISYDTGKITFYNFRVGGDDLSSRQDMSVLYVPAGQTQSVTKTITANPPVGTTAASGTLWDNCVWFLDVGLGTSAGKISTSPIVMGDILYVGCENGRLVSVDVGKVNREFSGVEKPVMPTNAPGMLWSQPVGGSSKINGAPAGSHGVLAVATNAGLTVLYNPVALVADGNRILEIDAGGRVSWACDSTTEIATTNTTAGAAAVYGAVKVAFNRPAVARRAEGSGYVVADTGNNRVVNIDSGGNVLWKITSFNDPLIDGKHILPAGMPLTLSRPTDVTMWTEFKTGVVYPEYHFLIADRGNFRVLEISAEMQFDDRGAPLGYWNVVKWVSPTILRGKRYEYVSARPTRWFVKDKNGKWMPETDYVCVASNEVRVDDPARPGGELVFPGGAIIRFSSSPELGAHNVVTAYDTLPETDTGPVADLGAKFSKPIFYDRVYTGVTDFTEVAIADGKVLVYDTKYGTLPPFDATMFTTAPDPSGKTTPLPFFPTYAQILPSGNILVTNKGTVGNSDYKGEVVELQYSGGWTIMDTRAGGSAVNSSGLRQPSSAERETD